MFGVALTQYMFESPFLFSFFCDSRTHFFINEDTFFIFLFNTSHLRIISISHFRISTSLSMKTKFPVKKDGKRKYGPVDNR